MADFDCTGCQHQHEVGDIPESEIENCILLMVAIFRPDRYQEIKATKTWG